MKKKCLLAWFKSSVIIGAYLIINMLAIIGTTVYLSFYNDDFYEIMYSVFMLNGEYSQLYDLIAYLVAPTTIITGIVIINIYIIKSCIQKKITIKKMSFKTVLLFISIGYVLNIITTLIVDIIPKNLTSNSYTESISLALSNENVFWLLLSTGIAAPILEEIIFRDWIYHSWSKINIIVAIIISSLFFGSAHMNLIQGTYAFILGIIFVCINEKFNSILPGIIMHLTVNSSTVLLESFKIIGSLWYVFFIIAIIHIIITAKNNGITFKNIKSTINNELLLITKKESL